MIDILKSCQYCGRIHDRKFDCGKKPKYKKRKIKENEAIRYTSDMKKKSVEIKENANYLCEYCKSKGILTYSNLETHHIEKLVDAPELALENSNLICLCRKCHEDAEKNVIQKNILKKIIFERENKK